MKESIIVMGGGVIGLSCALELRQRGYEVILLEKQGCGGQASGAAAGMLAPYSENVEGPDGFFQFCLKSLQLFPKWQEEVKRISGMSFEYSSSGSLYAVFHAADLLALEGRLAWQKQFGSTGRIIAGDELWQMEPLLSREVKAALYTPEESHVYAPDYVRALEQACRMIGVHIHDHLEQVEIVEWQQGVRLKAADGQVFNSDRLVICSGAWAAQQSEQLEVSFPVYPIRGQICAYDGVEHPVKHMVFSSQGYLVGKENGALVCGASEDIAGFNTSVTERGIQRLQNWSKRLFPKLQQMQPYHRWAGLRPSTQDGFPLIGKLYEKMDSVIMAVGHYRNGILLSPATAKLVADTVEGREIDAFNQAFVPHRFNC